MNASTVIKVFIASPDDVTPERDLIEKYITEWNSTHGDDRNIVLKAIRWENDLATQSNISAQDAINTQLLNDCDILIGMFWTKFGTPTKEKTSGTVGEIEDFIGSGKQVLLYFIDKPIRPSDAIKYSKSLTQIDNFKEKYKERGVYEITDLIAVDDFRVKFIKSLTTAINTTITKATSDEVGTNRQSSPDPSRLSEGKPWYKESIKELIDQKLSDQNLPYLTYNRNVSFPENCKLWHPHIDARNPDIIHKITKIREEAFDEKYGNYDYAMDLREKYKESWYKKILAILTQFDIKKDGAFSVIGIGANNGFELTQIFSSFQNVKLSVLDLSNEAIKKGKRTYKNISFHQGNMEECALTSASYDIYLNLRAIHSTGVDLRTTLSECHRLLKPNGIAIISVSNGYLTPNEIRKGEFVETKGMYDNRLNAFSQDKPYNLSEKIRIKMDSYGFRDLEIHTEQTEIFIVAVK